MTKPIPVRIPEDWLERIDRAAKRLGTNRARLIAFCAQTFADSFERTGIASMPPNWKEILNSMDGRKTIYSSHRPSGYSLNEKSNSKIAAVEQSLVSGEGVSYRKRRRAKKSSKPNIVVQDVQPKP